MNQVAAQPRTPRLLARDLSAGYGRGTVLHSVSITLHSGELVGLVGPNGAGKSTLLRVLSRALPAASGELQLEGRPLHRFSSPEIAQRIAFVPQSEPTLFEFTVREVVLMGRYAHIRTRSRECDEDYSAAVRGMVATDTLHLAERPITELSGGEHRRVLIARALAQEAPVMLLDEPTANLDISHQADVLRLVRGLVDREGVAAIAALHDLNLASEYCDRIALLAGGRIIAEGAPREVFTETLLERVYGLELKVIRNPASGQPMVLLPGQDLDSEGTRRIRVHVVCGGGYGSHLLTQLARRQYTITAGVLNRLDTDHETARALGLRCVEEAPFSPIGQNAREECAALMAEADAVVIAEAPIGSGNLANLDLAAEARAKGVAVVLYGATEPEERDFTSGEGARIWRAMESRGAPRARDFAELDALLERITVERREPSG